VEALVTAAGQGLSVTNMRTLDLAAKYAGRSVLVTGHTGFKGAWLSLWLHSLGAKVHGFALPPPTQPSLFEAARVRELLAGHHTGDLRDAAALDRALVAAQPEAVFHLAAQPLVRLSYREPVDTLETNVIGTAQVLEAVRRTGRPCAVVVVTSDKCYENVEQVWGYREIDPMGGSDPYSASKGMTELTVNAWRRSYFLPAAVARHGVRLGSARAGNVIGGGDWALDRIVTDVVASLGAGQPVPLRNPGAIRPWQHVLEPLRGYLDLGARLLQATTPEETARWATGWNFGPRAGEERTVRELVEGFIAAWGSGSWTDVSQPGQLHEARILRLSIEKAQTELGWSPRWNFATTVARTSAWYRWFAANPDASMYDRCMADLEAYEEGAV